MGGGERIELLTTADNIRINSKYTSKKKKKKKKGKLFNITVLQVYALTSNTEETEVL